MPKTGLDALLRPQDSRAYPTTGMRDAMSDSRRTRRPCNGRDRHRAQFSLAQQPERLT